MKFAKVRSECKKQRVHYDPKSYLACRWHNSNETLMHFMIKARLFFELAKRGYSVFTEFPIGCAVSDIYVLDRHWSLEIETKAINKDTWIAKQAVLSRNDIELWLIPVQDFADNFEGGVEKWVNKLGI